MFIYEDPAKTALEAPKSLKYENNSPSITNKSIAIVYNTLNFNRLNFSPDKLLNKACLKVLSYLDITGGKKVAKTIEQENTMMTKTVSRVILILLNDGLISFNLCYRIKEIQGRIKKFPAKEYNITSKGRQYLSSYINDIII